MNSDSPSVPIGLSEIVTLLTLVGSVLAAIFGRDWGITSNAQEYAGQAVVLLPIGLALARAIKHHGASASFLAASVPVVLDSLPAVAPVDTYPGDDAVPLAVMPSAGLQP